MYVNKNKTTKPQTKTTTRNKNKTTTTVAPRMKFKTTDVADKMISNILRDLRFSLIQTLKSADKWYIEILQNIIKTYEYFDFPLAVILNFPCDLTGCRFGDCNMIINCRVFKIKHYISVYI